MVPKSFKIFNTTWLIKNVNKVDTEGSMGYCDYNTATIKIRKNLRKEIKEQTVLHEQVHAILFTLGYDNLSHNEKFVEHFSQALHQVIHTQKYE